MLHNYLLQESYVYTTSWHQPNVKRITIIITLVQNNDNCLITVNWSMFKS